MLWSFEGLGFGHSSVAVANNKVYVTGIKDTIVSVGTLFNFDLTGNLLWQKDYGKDFTSNFHGTRSTPVIVGDLIYIESGMGAVYCLNAETGDQVWSVDFINDLGVDSVILFGFSESVLIDGDNLICVPGGKENNVVALNRFTGKKIWRSKGFEEPATYNSPILVNHNGQRLVIAMSASSIMGIDAATGEMLVQNKDLCGGSIIYADGLFYCYAENDGVVALVNASPEKFEIISKFPVPLGTDQHWARLVIKDKRLYVRHGNALMVYNIFS